MIGQESGELAIRNILKHESEGTVYPGVGFPGSAVDNAAGHFEVEDFIQLVGSIGLHQDGIRAKYLTDRVSVGLFGFVGGIKALQPAVGGGRIFQFLAFLDQVFDRVQAEAIHAHAGQPEAHHLVHECGHVGIGVIKIRHPIAKNRVVITEFPLMPGGTVRPGRSGVGNRPDEPVPVGGLQAAVGIDKERVLAGCMVEHQVDDHVHAAPVSFCEQALEIVQRPILRIDIEVIDDIIAVIGWGGLDRHQPQGVHAQVLQVVEFRGQAVKIADPVAIAIVKTAHEDLIKHGCLPPRNRQRDRRLQGKGCDRLDWC